MNGLDGHGFELGSRGVVVFLVLQVLVAAWLVWLSRRTP